MNHFVTAFAGRRDGYQIPLALAHAGMLQTFVTSFYLTDRYERLLRALLGRIPESLAMRRIPIPDSVVSSRVVPEVIEQLGRRIWVPPRKYWKLVNRMISRAAGDAASRAQSHLLLYEPYAYEAFTRDYHGFTPRKVLFHFHPHPELEAKIYAEDVDRYPPAKPWLTPDSGGVSADEDDSKSRHAWCHADLILCASSFTKRSLVFAGANPEICRVIPYGIDAPDQYPQRNSDKTFRALFVGSGIQRKGLHHLLTAWQRASLPKSALLTLVCQTIDPQLRAQVSTTPQCRLLPRVDRVELERLYLSASLLIVPSLVEGFGQVYLEALAHGCPVLGTANSGLPDLGMEGNGVFTVPPSDPATLESEISRFAADPMRDADADHSNAAWQTAKTFTWGHFRALLIESLQ